MIGIPAPAPAEIGTIPLAGRIPATGPGEGPGSGPVAGWPMGLPPAPLPRPGARGGGSGDLEVASSMSKPPGLPARRVALVAASGLALTAGLALAVGGRDGVTAFLAAREARRAIAAGDLDAAGAPLDRWLRTRPDSPEAHFLRARVASSGGRLDEATSHLDRAQWLGYPEGPAARLRALIWVRAGRFAEAEPILVHHLGATTEPDPEADQALARVFMETYRLDLAGKVIERWARDAPRDGTPYLWLTEIDRRLSGDMVEVQERHYRAALGRDPRLWKARLGLAEVLRATHRLEEAAREFASCEAHDPADPAGPVGLGRVALERGDLGAAAAHLDRALALAPDDPSALKDRASIDIRSGDDASAVRRLTRAIEADPLDAEPLYRRSLALARLGRKVEADVDARNLARLRQEHAKILAIRDRLMDHPEDLNVRCEMARWMFEHGRDDEGFRWVRQILAARPGHPATHRLLAEFYDRRGDPGRANYHRLNADQ